jgi:hypothetical protein
MISRRKERPKHKRTPAPPMRASLYEVFAEAINIFGKKVGRREAARAGKAILAHHATESLTIATSTPSILDAALDLLESVWQ